VKKCQAELYKYFVDPETSFKVAALNDFNRIIDDSSLFLDFEWLPDLETHEMYLSFNVLASKHNCYRIGGDGRRIPITRQEFDFVIIEVKRQAREAAMLMMEALDQQFPDVNLINALGVVFPQYWLQPNCHEMFVLHLQVIISYYCQEKRFRPDAENSEAELLVQILSRRDLENQVSVFKATMLVNCIKIMESRDITKTNPLTLLWLTLAPSNYLNGYMPEWFKVAQIAIVTVIGSVEDERTFSTLTWMKSKVRNRLSAHLDCTLRVYRLSLTFHMLQR
jgi:hypothetical protein